eukprot:12389654-Heterocapsa_arctica.AAC.1
MVARAQAVQRTDLRQCRDHTPWLPQQVAMLVNETVATPIELGLVRQHPAQVLHLLKLPPEAIARPFEAHVQVAQAALQDSS